MILFWIAVTFAGFALIDMKETYALIALVFAMLSNKD